jgi:hypothetical protein
LELRSGLKWGLYWSLVASPMVIPAAVVLRSWRLPLLAYTLIVALCVATRAITSRGRATRTAAGTLVWLLAVAAGLVLIGFGWYEIAHFTPYCTPSPATECRTLLNGHDAGTATVSDQRRDNFFDSLVPVWIGAVVLVMAFGVAIRLARDRRRRTRF